MKRVVETDENGFDDVLGEKIVLFCQIYIYSGRLVGVNDNHLELEDAKLVYETGELAAGQWKDAQPTMQPLRVMLQAIESWSLAKC